MCHNPYFIKQHKHQGSALVIAIFIIVVMTLLGTALIRMLSTSAESVVYEVIGTRAFNAAQSGLQIKLSQVFPLGGGLGTCDGTNEPVDLSMVKGLENCEVINLTCDLDATVEGTQYLTVKSTGQCDVAGVITSRTLEVQARSL